MPAVARVERAAVASRAVMMAEAVGWWVAAPLEVQVAAAPVVDTWAVGLRAAAARLAEMAQKAEVVARMEVQAVEQMVAAMTEDDPEVVADLTEAGPADSVPIPFAGRGRQAQQHESVASSCRAVLYSARSASLARV